MRWYKSHRADSEVRPLADRHYNRQKIGATHFAPPGRAFVLKTVARDAFWITSWPFAQYVRHAWAGAWVCSAFRNEGKNLSSELIREAVAATRAFYGEPPELGMITFVDTEKTRKKKDPGYCYLKAGFKRVGMTQSGLVALQLLPADMPEAKHPLEVADPKALKPRLRKRKGRLMSLEEALKANTAALEANTAALKAGGGKSGTTSGTKETKAGKHTLEEAQALLQKLKNHPKGGTDAARKAFAHSGKAKSAEMTDPEHIDKAYDNAKAKLEELDKAAEDDV